MSALAKDLGEKTKALQTMLELYGFTRKTTDAVEDVDLEIVLCELSMMRQVNSVNDYLDGKIAIEGMQYAEKKPEPVVEPEPKTAPAPKKAETTETAKAPAEKKAEKKP